MDGLMQRRSLALPPVFHRAEQIFGHKTMVTVRPDGVRHVTIAAWAQRVRRLATVLDQLGLDVGARVGTFAWNTQEHVELYFAAPCSGRILHTINVRLFTEQIQYVIEHAGDEALFVDKSLLPLVWPLRNELPRVRHWIVVDDGSDVEIPTDERVHDYDQLLARAAPFEGRFEVDDENSAAAICYTSGTTGNPKGVVYSHRSILLHSMLNLMADHIGLSERDTVLPVVPMFHVNAWGLPYASVMAGATLVLPGSRTDPESILGLLERQRVTVTAGVPTVWNNAVPHLSRFELSSLRIVVCGGAAVPVALSEAWRVQAGVPITQAWGMTETSPMASFGSLRSHHDDLDAEGLSMVRASQGQVLPLIDLRLVDAYSGAEVPWDGTSVGELQASGPWVASGYLGDGEGGDSFTEDGWLRTGDIAGIDSYGYIRLVDRSKDLVKSGGEWISSVDLENHIMAHPAVLEAAVIAKPDEKWSERPVACVVLHADELVTGDDILNHLADRVAKWWLPDEVHFLDEIPKTSTGKFSKKTLRERFYPSDVNTPPR